MSLARRLYDAAPVALQDLAVSAVGLRNRLRRQRTSIVRRRLALLMDSQHWSREQFEDYQRVELQRLLRHAFEHVPHYRRLRAELGIDAAVGDSFAALRAMPILERDALKEHARDFVDETIPARRLWRGRTSGTTGSPLEYFHTPECLAPRYAYMARLRAWAGVGDPLFPRRAAVTGKNIVGAGRSGATRVHWRRNLAENTLLLSASHISTDTASHYMQALRDFAPKVIEGYPSAIAAIARLGGEAGIRVPGVEAVLTTSETLSDDQRRDIERVFDCRVFDHYGAKEPSCFWSECEHGRMHIHPEYGISEILRSDGTPAAPGEQGDIVVTSFLAGAMPLIRYRIGDAAVAGDGSPCPCGRAMPTVARLLGRADETLTLKGGRTFQRFSCVFTPLDGVVEAQVVQEALDRIRVLVVPNERFDDFTEDAMLADLQQRVGPETRVVIDRVAHIPRGPNGKLRGVVNRIQESPLCEGRPDTRRELLFVANKRVPSGDYRVQYARKCGKWKVRLGMPGRPEGVQPQQFTAMAFGESLGLSDIPAFWRLYRYLRANRERTACANFFSTKLTLLGPIVARLAGVRAIGTVTGFGRVFNDPRPVYRLLRPIYKALLWAGARCGERTLFQNRADMEQARRWMPETGKRFAYIGSGVAGEARRERREHRGPLRALMVARLLPSKGIRDFLDSAKRLRGEGIEFVLVGPPSAGCEDLLDEVTRCAQRGAVAYRGELHGAELKREYDAADIFLFTSHGEGLPRVMLEAGFAALCPVAYDLNANKDLVLDGGGFLAPIGDLDRIERVLRQLIGDRDLLRRNAERFQEHITEAFSIDAFIERLDRVFEETLGADASQELPTAPIVDAPTRETASPETADVH